MNNDSPSQIILIVDDTRLDIELLEKILTDNGYKTLSAQNGAHALEVIQCITPDLILLDIMMPLMNGISLCQELKKQESTRNIPVIFLTALSDIQHKIEAFQVGGVDYVTKPFIQQEVLARINVHINLKKALEKLEEVSITDEMTGVCNRRFAYNILAKQIEMAKREQSGFVVCYIDIDNLKIINDTYGHAEGDRLIQTVVDSLSRVIRGSDYICRMGGDEFLLIFPKAKLKDSDNLIERLRNELNHQTLCDLSIDFSFGLSKFHAGDSISADELIKMADSCMFKAKKKKKSCK